MLSILQTFTSTDPNFAIFSAILGLLIVIVSFFAIAIYAYKALTMQTIAKKLGYKKHWLAWIPIVNYFLYPILAKRDWKWGFIILLPILMIPFMLITKIYGSIFYFLIAILVLVFTNIWAWDIFVQRGYPGYLSLVYILSIVPIINMLASLGLLVILGIVAWRDVKQIKTIKENKPKIIKKTIKKKAPVKKKTVAKKPTKKKK